MSSYLEGSLWYTVQLVVGQDEMPQVHEALEVRVVQGGEAVGIQVKGVEILEVGEGVRQDLTDGVSAQGQVDLHGGKETGCGCVKISQNINLITHFPSSNLWYMIYFIPGFTLVQDYNTQKWNINTLEIRPHLYGFYYPGYDQVF